MSKHQVFSERTGSQSLRVGFLDEVRGLCIILMVLYHGAFNAIFLFGWDITLPEGTRLITWFLHTPAMRFAQPFVAGIFIFISGIACRYSRSNLRRGILALSLGFVITAFTLFFMPNMAIYFGILHFLGSGMILFALLHRALDQIPMGWGLLFSLAAFALTFGVYTGRAIGIPGLWAVSIPAAWASNAWLIPIGFAAGGADHFPLLPWIFLFLAGSYLGIAFTQRDMPQLFYRSRSRFLGMAGRHTIIIYLLHQPVLYGSMYVISLLIARGSTGGG